MLCFLLLGSSTVIKAQLASCHNKFVGNIWYDGNIPLNFDQYFNQLTPENATKWSSVQGGGPNSWDWGQALNMYNYCKSNGIPFKYHTLVWGNQYPSWVDNASDKAAVVENWIREAGRIFPDCDFVDVVNECLPNHAQPSWLGDIGGQNGLYGTGWDWVVWSFEKARQYFPDSKLLINDYNILNNSWNNDLDVLCEIVNILNDRGLIDGIGLQSHGLQNTSGADVTARLNRITSLCPGVPIYISEFDLDIANDDQQRNKMAELFPIFWNNAAIEGITFWGYVQGHTWIPNSHLIRSDGSERPAMVWLKDYLDCSGCTPTAITPYVQIDSDAWQQTSSVTVDARAQVKFGPQPVSGGSWSWSGPNGFTASTREVTISNIEISQAGDYIATYTNDGGCESSQTFTVTVTAATGGGSGTILREYWTGISGTSISNLTSNASYPNSPSGSEQLTSLEGPTNWDDNYGTRIRGYIHPTTSGSYTFWVAGDDNTELYLSTDDNPANASRIAYVDGWTNSREWDKYSTQQSASVSLTAGQKYYVEVLHKEGSGGDNVAVAWQGPGITQQVIAGSYLSPYDAGSIVVRARGSQGDETIDLRVDGNTIATWTLGTAYADYTASGSGAVTVHFTNDGSGRDVQIDYVTRAGVTYQSEDQQENTGVWTTTCGGSNSEWLNCSGYISYTSASAGAGTMQTDAKVFSKTVDLLSKDVDDLSSEVTIYPNPANEGRFFITLPGNLAHATINIHDKQGRLLFEKHAEGDTTLELDHRLAAGIYFIKVKSDQINVTKKLIVD